MGLDNFVNKAKSALNNSDDTIQRLKEEATDERIDQVADHIKKVTPDSVDAKVDALAEKAKEANN